MAPPYLSAPMLFSGSFTEQNGVVSNVNISDSTSWGGTFTVGTQTGPNSIRLTDFYNGVPSSSFITLSFNMNSQLVGVPSIDVGSLTFQADSDYPSTCGGIPGLQPFTYACSASIKAEPAAAPEIGFDGGLLTLLAGALCVMRGRTAKQTGFPSVP